MVRSATINIQYVGLYELIVNSELVPGTTYRLVYKSVNFINGINNVNNYSFGSIGLTMSNFDPFQVNIGDDEELEIKDFILKSINDKIKKED